MTETHTDGSTLKAIAAATGTMLLMWGVLVTPFGVLFVVLFGVFVAGPLDSLGVMDLGEWSNGFFVPNLTALALLGVPCWLFLFWLFRALFKTSAERARKIDEA